MALLASCNTHTHKCGTISLDPGLDAHLIVARWRRHLLSKRASTRCLFFSSLCFFFHLQLHQTGAIRGGSTYCWYHANPIEKKALSLHQVTLLTSSHHHHHQSQCMQLLYFLLVHHCCSSAYFISLAHLRLLFNRF